jgi:hypothetical protein
MISALQGGEATVRNFLEWCSLVTYYLLDLSAELIGR